MQTEPLRSDVLTPSGAAAHVGMLDFVRDPPRNEGLVRVRIQTNEYAPRHLTLTDGVTIGRGQSEATFYATSVPLLLALVAGPDDHERMAAAEAEYARRRSVEVRDHVAKTDPRFEGGLTAQMYKLLVGERDAVLLAAEKTIDETSPLSLAGTFYALHETDYPPLASVEVIDAQLAPLPPHHPQVERVAMAEAIGARTARPDANVVTPAFVAEAISAALQPLVAQLTQLAAAIAGNTPSPTNTGDRAPKKSA